MQRAAERLDLEHKSGTVLSTRPSPEDVHTKALFDQRRAARLEGHLAAGFVPGRHAWFILGRPTVVRPQHKQNSPPLLSLPPLLGGSSTALEVDTHDTAQKS